MKKRLFLKPTTGKILIAILLLFPVSNTTCGSFPPKDCMTAYLPLIMSFMGGMPASGITLDPQTFYLGITNWTVIVLVIFGIILSYLIACVLFKLLSYFLNLKTKP